ncbi:MAG: hypothetical protein ACUVSX_13665 [Aggregatilineales bacterium]
MLYALSVDAVLVGGVLGLILGVLIVCLLVYAAFRAVHPEHELDAAARPLSSWPSLTRYDSHRPPLETHRRDLDIIEW